MSQPCKFHRLPEKLSTHTTRYCNFTKQLKSDKSDPDNKDDDNPEQQGGGRCYPLRRQFHIVGTVSRRLQKLYLHEINNIFLEVLRSWGTSYTANSEA